jgi:3-hydroxybutyryl-CoA dehydrogenase
MKNKTIENIAIIGGDGLMGMGIAQVFAAKGLNVVIHTIRPEVCTALEDIANQQNMLLEEGLISLNDKHCVLDHIEITSDFNYAIEGVDLVIESIPENLELKQSIFQKIEAGCSSDCIIATNTSVISVTEIAAVCQHKDRILGTHFWNPATLIPLVEVIKTEYTDPDIYESVFSLLTDVGKKPAKCLRDVPGFLANRLQHALWREAFYMLDQGIADARTIDDCIKNSFGFRLPQLAPFENSDMVGADLTLNIHRYILKHLCSDSEPSPYLKSLVAENQLGFKTGQGFFEWGREQISKSKYALNKYLIDQLKYRKETHK